MLKLTRQQRLRLWLWQHRRSVVLSGASLLALLLTVLGNSQLLSATALPAQTLPLLTLAQLAAGGLLALLVLIVTD